MELDEYVGHVHPYIPQWPRTPSASISVDQLEPL